MLKIYLDNRCLNRPYDDQSQERTRRESEAVLAIIRDLISGRWEWVGSEALSFEINQIQDPVRRKRLQAYLRSVIRMVAYDEIDMSRARLLQANGFKAIDALHVVCAERAGCDILLTTDDQMVSVGGRLAKMISVPIMNPIIWLEGAPKA